MAEPALNPETLPTPETGARLRLASTSTPLLAAPVLFAPRLVWETVLDPFASGRVPLRTPGFCITAPPWGLAAVIVVCKSPVLESWVVYRPGAVLPAPTWVPGSGVWAAGPLAGTSAAPLMLPWGLSVVAERSVVFVGPVALLWVGWLRLREGSVRIAAMVRAVSMLWIGTTAKMWRTDFFIFLDPFRVCGLKRCNDRAGGDVLRCEMVSCVVFEYD